MGFDRTSTGALSYPTTSKVRLPFPWTAVISATPLTGKSSQPFPFPSTWKFSLFLHQGMFRADGNLNKAECRSSPQARWGCARHYMHVGSADVPAACGLRRAATAQISWSAFPKRTAKTPIISPILTVLTNRSLQASK
jgi:hypothetical protein